MAKHHHSPAPAVAPAPKLGVSASALALIFSDVPHALNGDDLTVTYPTLAAYEARAQADMTSLSACCEVRESSVTTDPTTGAQVLVALLSH